MARDHGGGATGAPALPPELIRDRLRGMAYGLLVADALSMPVHWYYNPDDITRRFGLLTDFQPAPSTHPGSIMPLSATGTGGRGEQDGDIIGRVINHGKKPLWGRRGVHYHHGMAAVRGWMWVPSPAEKGSNVPACPPKKTARASIASLLQGENTLNAACARLLLRTLAADGGVYSRDRWLSEYARFMTTPGSHNDTYGARSVALPGQSAQGRQQRGKMKRGRTAPPATAAAALYPPAPQPRRTTACSSATTTRASRCASARRTTATTSRPQAGS
jgi:hypothetical protein